MLTKFCKIIFFKRTNDFRKEEAIKKQSDHKVFEEDESVDDDEINR